jgi:hypothetical protein
MHKLKTRATHAKPYENTVRFLSDLNQKKNLYASSAVIPIDKA